MHVAIFTYGSRGDVQPFFALANELTQRGHKVVVAGPGRLQDAATTRGIDYRNLDDRLADFFLSDEDVIAVNTGTTTSPTQFVRTWKKLRTELNECLPGILNQITEIAREGADVLVQCYDELPFEQSHHLAEHLDIPFLIATLSPNFVTSSAYPSKMLPPDRTYPALVNRASHGLRPFMRSLGYWQVDAWRRKELGLPRRWRQTNRMRTSTGAPTPTIHCLSPAVFPPGRDWKPWAVTTGYLFTEPLGGAPDQRPPEGLDQFLQRGPAPVCISFGSVSGGDAAERGRIVQDELRRTGTRAVVITADNTIELDSDGDENLFVTPYVPYAWLFPKVQGVIHGGSAGIGSEALRAGIPQACIPAAVETALWARPLTEVGVAPDFVLGRDLTRERFASLLSSVTNDERLRSNATALAEVVASERGAENAADHVELFTALWAPRTQNSRRPTKEAHGSPHQ